MEETAKNLSIEKKNFDKQEFEEMGNELNFKEVQTENAQITLVRVRQELFRRREDFMKIHQFERLFPQKIKGLRQRLDSIKKEIAQFDNREAEKKFLASNIGKLQLFLMLTFCLYNSNGILDLVELMTTLMVNLCGILKTNNPR